MHILDDITLKLTPFAELEEFKLTEHPIQPTDESPRGGSRFLTLAVKSEQRIAPKWHNLDFEVHVWFRVLKSLGSRAPLNVVQRLIHVLDNKSVLGEFQISNKIKFVSYNLESKDSGGYYHYIVNFTVNYSPNGQS